MPKEPVRKRLTRKEMEDLVNAGQSVIHNGEMITTIEGLPTDVDLTLDDADAESRLSEHFDRQIETLQQEKARATKLAAERAAQRQRAEKARGDEGKPARDEAAADEARTGQETKAADKSLHGAQAKPQPK